MASRTGARRAGPRRAGLLAILLLGTGAAAFYLLGSARTPASARCHGCNVVLVTFDALRADRLGVYGYAQPTSPFLDALPRESAVFRRCLSQSGSTLSSVPSIHTAKFPNTDRLLDKGVLRESERTLAEMLRDKGYDTTAVIAHEYARCKWGSCQGFANRDDTFVAPEAADQTGNRVLARLAAPGDRPFFLWIHFRQPHFPYNPSPALFAQLYPSTDGPTFYPGPWSFDFRLPYLVTHYRELGEPETTVHLAGGLHAVTPTVLRQLVAMYDGSIREGDRQIGRLRKRLATLGVARRTVLVVAADHGESLGEHGVFDHNMLWYGILHTPLIVHVPGVPARVSDGPVMNVDILPTILDVLGFRVPDRIRGESVFAGGRHDGVQYAEYHRSQTVVRGDLQLISAPVMSERVKGTGQLLHEGTHLFDLAADPEEAVDLVPSRPEAVAELEAIIGRIRDRSLARDSQAPDTDVEEQLRALGYVQ